MGWKVARGAAAALAVVAVGCGGAKPLTHAELVRQANAICARGRTARRAGERGVKSLRQFAERVVVIEGKIVRELGALRPPSEIDGRYERFVSYDRLQLAQMRQALAGAPKVARGKARTIGLTRVKVGRELGLTACL